MEISTILSQIDLGAMALPEFQRGYVWNRDQVRTLMDSLYHRHPVGALLVWVTKTEDATVRGTAPLAPGAVKLILDGQQRITSLYGVIRGRPPAFFHGNQDAFLGLYFNLDQEVFEFYSSIKMKGDPLWVNVTDLMRKGIGDVINQLLTNSVYQPKLTTYINRLNAIQSVGSVDLHIEEVAGEDKTVDVVVNIFNRVNSGGTKLSKGDLALARVCASWPDARKEMQSRLDTWKKAGFDFRLEWLLRCINTIVTGEALFSALKDVSPSDFQQGLTTAEKTVNTLLNLIGTRLGLDHGAVLGSPYSFPVMARYLAQRNGQPLDYRDRGKLLYWYINTFLWGRYAGTTETVLNQDLHLIEDHGTALDSLIGRLRQERGDLALRADDFRGWSTGTRFYSLLYMLTRVWHAQDWATGIELSSHLLGKGSRLELHHIFPKAQLYKAGYNRPEANALANFAFLTEETNRAISDKLPEMYLAEYAATQPTALESYGIPMDPQLWKVARYRDFLAARRELLAAVANDFLNRLVAGSVPDRVVQPLQPLTEALAPGAISTDDEQSALLEANLWVVDHRLPEGQLLYELADPTTSKPLAILDLAWPEGLQPGYSQPVALLLNESQQIEEIANRAGYRFFTNVETFQDYVRREVLAVAETIAA